MTLADGIWLYILCGVATGVWLLHTLLYATTSTGDMSRLRTKYWQAFWLRPGGVVLLTELFFLGVISCWPLVLGPMLGNAAFWAVYPRWCRWRHPDECDCVDIASR